MDAGLHWMDIKIVPQTGVDINKVIKEIGKAIKAGAKAGAGNADYVFRVVGENRVVAALNGGVHRALESVNNVAGSCIEVTTSPCRTYEGFAQNVIGVDPAILKTKEGGIGNKGRVLWMNALVDYKGLTQQQLLDSWKREVEKAFPARAKGEMNFQLYKLAGKREVIALFRTEDIETWDDGIWKLPIYAEMGEQIETFVKSLDFL